MTDWTRALKLEQEVARIITQQEINGVAFDKLKAHGHVIKLEHYKKELYNQIRPSLIMELVVPYTVEIKKPFLKNGGYSKAVIDWYADPSIVGGPFTRIDWEEPDLGSRQKVIKQMLRLGWKPDMFTEKGSPKLTDKGLPTPSLERFPVGELLAKYYTYSHRQSQIKGWIENVRPDGRITAGANSCGTNTARMRHRTVVNVPKADPKVLFGHEMRELFIARQGYRLVGHDASGLEARMMAHYTYKYDDGEFADLILNGDIHAHNARIFFEEEVADLSTDSPEFKSFRSRGKNGTYCLMYGGQPAKLASTLGVAPSKAKYLFDAFWRGNPALGKLRDIVIRMSENQGWIPGLDGRRIFTRSSHSALNALFQSGGAIVMKQSMVLLDRWVREKGLRVYKVLDMHDESQAEVPEMDCYFVDDIERCEYGELACESIREAGRILNLKCDLDADYSIGSNWAETH